MLNSFMIHLLYNFIPLIINKYEMRVLIRTYIFYCYLGATIKLINGLVVKHDIVKKSSMAVIIVFMYMAC